MNEYLKTIKDKYPNAWKQADGFRADSDMPKWEPWCFLPIAGWIAVASAGNNPTFDDIAGANKLAALGSWRMTQGIFKFDDVLTSELTKTPFSGELPSDVLTRLPHWCCYIPYKFDYLDQKAVGFFVFLEQDMNNENIELRFLIDYGDFETLTTAVIHLGNWTITESVNKFALIAKKNSGNTLDVDIGMVEQISFQINPLVNLVLYLCSQEPDYGTNSPSWPREKKTKKGMRVFAVPGPTVFDVGKNIGDVIKKVTRESCKSNNLPHTKRPHIRKAHWHGFWTGSKTNGNKPRKYIHKWLPPTLIGIK